MAPTDKRRVHIFLPGEDLHDLDARAKAERPSRNAYINKTIQWAIEQHPERFGVKDIQARG